MGNLSDPQGHWLGEDTAATATSQANRSREPRRAESGGRGGLRPDSPQLPCAVHACACVPQEGCVSWVRCLAFFWFSVFYCCAHFYKEECSDSERLTCRNSPSWPSKAAVRSGTLFFPRYTREMRLRHLSNLHEKRSIQSGFLCQSVKLLSKHLLV